MSRLRWMTHRTQVPDCSHVVNRGTTDMNGVSIYDFLTVFEARTHFFSTGVSSVVMNFHQTANNVDDRMVAGSGHPRCWRVFFLAEGFVCGCTVVWLCRSNSHQVHEIHGTARNVNKIEFRSRTARKLLELLQPPCGCAFCRTFSPRRTFFGWESGFSVASGEFHTFTTSVTNLSRQCSPQRLWHERIGSGLWYVPI